MAEFRALMAEVGVGVPSADAPSATSSSAAVPPTAAGIDRGRQPQAASGLFGSVPLSETTRRILQDTAPAAGSLLLASSARSSLSSASTSARLSIPPPLPRGTTAPAAAEMHSHKLRGESASPSPVAAAALDQRLRGEGSSSSASSSPLFDHSQRQLLRPPTSSVATPSVSVARSSHQSASFSPAVGVQQHFSVSSTSSSASRRRVPGLLGLPLSVTVSATATAADIFFAGGTTATLHEREELVRAEAEAETKQMQQAAPVPVLSSSAQAAAAAAAVAPIVSRPSSGSAAVDRLRSMIEAAETSRAERRRLRVRDEIGAALLLEGQRSDAPPSEAVATTTNAPATAETAEVPSSQTSSLSSSSCAAEEDDGVRQEHQEPQPDDELCRLQRRDWAAEREQRRAAEHAQREAELAAFLLGRRVQEASAGLVWDERVVRAELEAGEHAARAALAETLFDSLSVVRAVAAIEEEETAARAANEQAARDAFFLPIAAAFVRQTERVERHAAMQALQRWYNSQFSALERGAECVAFGAEEAGARRAVERQWREGLPPLLDALTRRALETLGRELWLLEVREADGRGHVESDAAEFFLVATEGQRWSRPLMQRRAGATVQARERWRAHIAEAKADLVEQEAAQRVLVARGALTAGLHLLEEERTGRAAALERQEQRRAQAALREAERYSQELQQQQQEQQQRERELLLQAQQQRDAQAAQAQVAAAQPQLRRPSAATPSRSSASRAMPVPVPASTSRPQSAGTAKAPPAPVNAVAQSRRDSVAAKPATTAAATTKKPPQGAPVSTATWGILGERKW